MKLKIWSEQKDNSFVVYMQIEDKILHLCYTLDCINNLKYAQDAEEFFSGMFSSFSFMMFPMKPHEEIIKSKIKYLESQLACI